MKKPPTLVGSCSSFYYFTIPSELKNHVLVKLALTAVIMKVMVTMVAFMPIFVTFFMTFWTFKLMVEIMTTLRAFITFYLTFMMTFWTLVMMMVMAFFTIMIVFKTIHSFTSLL
jgi:hypothetical protein